MIANIIKYKKLTKEQFLYIRRHLSKSARALKKYTAMVKKKERVQFRAIVLGAWRNGAIDMDRLAQALDIVPASEHEQFLEDLKTVYIVKSQHSILNGQTIEDALVSGYIPLFTSWCNGNQDKLSEFIVKIMDSIYLYTKPRLSLIEYLKKCHRSMSARFTAEESGIIKYPEKWNLLRLRFDENMCKNPTMSVEEVMNYMGLTKKQKNNLKQQIEITSTMSMSDCDKVIQDKVSEQIPNLGINLSDVPLTDLQRKSINAFMHCEWGWQTKLASETINPETGKPYSKMSINNNLKSAIEAIRNYMGLRNE